MWASSGEQRIRYRADETEGEKSTEPCNDRQRALSPVECGGRKWYEARERLLGLYRQSAIPGSGVSSIERADRRPFEVQHCSRGSPGIQLLRVQITTTPQFPDVPPKSAGS
jgi:hypothetical protein